MKTSNSYLKIEKWQKIKKRESLLWCLVSHSELLQLLIYVIFSSFNFCKADATENYWWVKKVRMASSDNFKTNKKYKSDKLSVITKFTSARLENSFHCQELGRSLTPGISVQLNIQELFQDKALYLLWIILCRVFFFLMHSLQFNSSLSIVFTL